MRPFWNPLIKDFHLVVLWGFKYGVEKMAWHPYLEWNPIKEKFKTWLINFQLRCSFYSASYSKSGMILKLLEIITELSLLGWALMKSQYERFYERFINSSSLWNSGARYGSNKMTRCFQNFSICLGILSAKKLPKTQQKPLYITSAMAPAYLDFFTRAKLCCFNRWSYLLYLNYIIYL